MNTLRLMGKKMTTEVDRHNYFKAHRDQRLQGSKTMPVPTAFLSVRRLKPYANQPWFYRFQKNSLGAITSGIVL